MTFKTRLSVLLLSTPVLVFVVVGGLMGSASTPNGDNTYQHLRVFHDVVSLVLNNYVEEVKIDRAMEGALKGLADGLDPDSAYLSARQVADLEAAPAQAEGEVGLEITRQYYLRVISARDGSPAAAAGLQTGDYVRAIDGKPTRDMSVFEGTRLLRGQPGSKIVLTIIRGNAALPHEVPLVRGKPAGPLVSGRLISLGGGGVAPASGTTAQTGSAGYVRIASFRSGVVEDLTKQVAALSTAGAGSLVIDLRGTAEGPLENGIAAARLFVKSGTLSIRAGRNGGNKETIEAGAADGAIGLPVQLLVTGGTSGPAELFATALRDNKRAELVGEHTLGRAGLQKLVKLPEGRGLWLTYAQYYRSATNLQAQERKPPSSSSSTPDIGTGGRPNAPKIPGAEAIHGKGLQPDVPVEDAEVAEFGAPRAADDPILDSALDRLRKKAV
ncbi:MAG: S41 family peptidase [Acidobacteriota bacterium]|nr:S41 family peptidase [Acidobacteriota bacterium]